LPNGPRTALVITPIIIEPWMPTISRYRSGGQMFCSGCRSSTRMSMAWRPAIPKKTPTPTKYCFATTLWSGVKPK
jgi:hypothetical protein